MFYFTCALVVSVILSSLYTFNHRKDKTSSIYHFNIRGPIGYAFLGGITAPLPIICIILTYHQLMMNDGTLVDSAPGEEVPVLAGFYIFLILSLSLILIYTPAFFDIRIDDDDIKVMRWWIYRKHYNVKDIDHCVMKHGHTLVYMKGKKHFSFLVEMGFRGEKNFIRRMNKEGIPVEDRRNCI